MTVVVAVLVASSADLAVMVTVAAVAGAVQAPDAASMVPALADQVMPLVAPPVAVALKVVVVPTELTIAAGLTALRATVRGTRVRLVVAMVPAALVTVRMKFLGPVMGPLPKELPLVTTPTP